MTNTELTLLQVQELNLKEMKESNGGSDERNYKNNPKELLFLIVGAPAFFANQLIKLKNQF